MALHLEVAPKQNRDLLALGTIVRIKNRKLSGLGLKKVFLMICTKMIYL